MNANRLHGGTDVVSIFHRTIAAHVNFVSTESNEIDKLLVTVKRLPAIVAVEQPSSKLIFTRVWYGVLSECVRGDFLAALH